MSTGSGKPANWRDYELDRGLVLFHTSPHHDMWIDFSLQVARVENLCSAARQELAKCLERVANSVRETDKRLAPPGNASSPEPEDAPTRKDGDPGGDSCPHCGYTDEDKRIHGDYYLCERDHPQLPAAEGREE